MKRRPHDHAQETHRRSGLSDEDYALWHQVRKTVEPLSQRDQGRVRDLVEKAAEEYQADSSTSRKSSRLSPPGPEPGKARHTREYPVPTYSPPRSGIAGGNNAPAGVSRRNGAIDDRTARKLLKGKISVDSRIDLHGMTQDQAHRALTRFLASSHGAGDRMVLVITGKGRMSDGVLRQAVPNWLREPALSVYVSAFRTAHVTHGGDGALYVRIRRRSREQSR